MGPSDLLLAYPLVMALLWMVLALLQASGAEARERWLPAPPASPSQMPPPPVSVLIPCFNEGPLLAETLYAALVLQWPTLEVIAINDGSSDDTAQQLEAWAALEPRLRVVHLASNQGKALALRAGALLARHELLLCIDADARLDPMAAAWLLRHFQGDPRLAAVTGNPRIRNRSTLLGRLQVGEFSMIIGLIKRAQSALGGLYCVSGVIGAFRRSALHAVGYWDPHCLTEDIAITWRLQREGWRVHYEPHAVVWILMPETLRGLWRQRLRWAEGGQQVLLANLDLLVKPGQWRLWPLLLEPLCSLLWAYGLALLLLTQLLGKLGSHGAPATPPAPASLPGPALVLALVCLLQFAVSFWLDRPYDRGLARNGFWMIWYPLAFWLLSFSTTLIALPRMLLGQRRQRARWVSPDRGLPA